MVVLGGGRFGPRPEHLVGHHKTIMGYNLGTIQPRYVKGVKGNAPCNQTLIRDLIVRLIMGVVEHHFRKLRKQKCGGIGIDLFDPDQFASRFFQFNFLACVPHARLVIDDYLYPIRSRLCGTVET